MRQTSPTEPARKHFSCGSDQQKLHQFHIAEISTAGSFKHFAFYILSSCAGAEQAAVGARQGHLGVPSILNSPAQTQLHGPFVSGMLSWKGFRRNQQNTVVSQRSVEFSLAVHPGLPPTDVPCRAGWEVIPFPKAMRGCEESLRTETELTNQAQKEESLQRFSLTEEFIPPGKKALCCSCSMDCCRSAFQEGCASGITMLGTNIPRDKGSLSP